jgi:uncharacterized phiE125 gp8 family phage protein
MVRGGSGRPILLFEVSMLAPVRTAPSQTTPVSLTEAKTHLRVEAAVMDDDALITSLIQAATDHLDGWTGILGRCLMTQQWQQDFWCWPDCRILRLPFPDVSASTVKYFDEDNASQDVADDMVAVLSDVRGSFIRFSDAFTYPGLYNDRGDRVQVTLTAGYGDATKVPSAIKAAILLLVGNWYANREAVTADPVIVLPMAVDALLAPYRRVGV